jgi:hypothetical protein
MKMLVDPMVVAVALGLLNPSVFDVTDDPSGEVNLPPMIAAAQSLTRPDTVVSKRTTSAAQMEWDKA